MLAALLVCRSAYSQTAEWVWSDERGAATPTAGSERYFRCNFTVVGKVNKADLNVAGNEEFTVFLNGKRVGEGKRGQVLKREAGADLRGGDNVIAIQAKQPADRGAVVAVLSLDQEYDKRQVVMTDRSWVSSSSVHEGWNQSGYDTHDWTNVALVAKLGAAPWGNVFNADAASATPADQITVPAGFKVELLRSAESRDGSWVSMAIDDKGRLYISPQYAVPGSGFSNKNDWGGIVRVTIDEHGQVAKWDRVKVPIGGAMGMLWAFDSLYVSGQGPEGQGIYRLRDTDGDDNLDKAELFKKIPGGGGEHGAHAIVLGPDHKLYIANGNSTPLMDGIAPDSQVHHYAEDYLLPRIKDPVATFFDKLKVPYGQLWRTDENGTKWELYASGFRNHYDIAFNPEGELFTYDSDMEWDEGLPWYRPTRILHITSGAEFGFREGNTKWPEWYPDSLPSICVIGRGSPTGIAFGTRSNFPEKYKRALFAMDWTFGRILAVHLQPHGASYEGVSEDFLKGKGMPVTDLEFGSDGAMYFVVGGRGTQSGLYRVSYVGDAAKPVTEKPLSPEDTPEAKAARDLRRRLEAFHGKEDPAALDIAWPQLNSEDRFMRYAARIAVESQPVEKWRDRALAEAQPRAGLTALLALVRCGSKTDEDPVLMALTKWPIDSLEEPLQLEKMRVIELAFIRHGRPAEKIVEMGTAKLDRQYPAATYPMNHELSQLLVWLNAPDVVEKTLGLLEGSPKPDGQIWFACVLGAYEGPWTMDQRRRFFAWFNKARDYKGGNSFSKFIEKIKEESVARLNQTERAELAAILSPREEPAAPKPAAPTRQFVKAWTVAELSPALDKANHHRNFARGKEIFSSVQCIQCHHFAQDGGNVGPDLTAVGNRFNLHDLLEAIIEPSKAVSEQYANFIVTLKNGDTVAGLVVDDNNDHLTMLTDPLAGTRQEVAKSQIQKKEMSPISPMPPGLLSVLSEDEIMDLLAYLESAGNPNAPQFSAAN